MKKALPVLIGINALAAAIFWLASHGPQRARMEAPGGMEPPAAVEGETVNASAQFLAAPPPVTQSSPRPAPRPQAEPPSQTEPAREATFPLERTPEMPLAFKIGGFAWTNLDGEQQQAVAELQQRFLDDVGGRDQDPNDPQYLGTVARGPNQDRWAAQRSRRTARGGHAGGHGCGGGREGVIRPEQRPFMRKRPFCKG